MSRLLMPMGSQWYNGVEGALEPWTDNDTANLSTLLLQSDPYRQQSFRTTRDLAYAANSPFAVFNPRYGSLYPMAANSAWDEEYRQPRRFGVGIPQSPNMYGGDYGLSLGGSGAYWGVPHHLGGHEDFDDYYTDPW